MKDLNLTKNCSSERIKETFLQEGSVFLPGFFNEEECTELKKQYEKNVKYNDSLFYRIKSNKREKNLFTSSGFVVNPFMNLHLEENKTVAAPFKKILQSERINHLLKPLLGENYRLFKSMYFESNRGTERHFDTDIFGPDTSMIGIWVALEKITPENGGFFYYPKTNFLWKDNYPNVKAKDLFNQYRMYSSLKKDGYLNQDKSTLLSIYKKGNEMLSDALAEIESEQVTHTYLPGDLVLFDGKLLHGSFRPTNYEQSRNSLSAHFI